jgi:4-aminobutyrate aminotransferase-like enzyme
MTDDLVGRRRAAMGTGPRLTYARPVHAVSASGVWITEADGTELLDAYNNVPHVGHARPEVVAAIAEQSARLNTTMRYLVDEVVEYAERLTGLFPTPLDTVLFANSGSEANDLAWRMARTVTGRSGVIVTDNAYHGATELTMATSPEETDRVGAPSPSWVARIPVPEVFESTRLDRAVEALDAAGHGVALLAVDTVFSSDGIYDPGQVVGELARQARASGGLFVADEVQAGFGRVGARWWGFASSGTVPDIVTLGKPMGNGVPLAAVVTSRDIADRFFERGYYFSTFAGNPVAAAAGTAVLDVMESESLAEQAGRVGDRLRAALVTIDHPVLGEVRGVGQFSGVDIVNDDGLPAPERAHRLMDQMRERRVLVGRTGPVGSVLKIRPPLVFDEQHVEFLVDALCEALTES